MRVYSILQDALIIVLCNDAVNEHTHRSINVYTDNYYNQRSYYDTDQPGKCRIKVLPASCIPARLMLVCSGPSLYLPSLR